MSNTLSHTLCLCSFLQNLSLLILSRMDSIHTTKHIVFKIRNHSVSKVSERLFIAGDARTNSSAGVP